MMNVGATQPMAVNVNQDENRKKYKKKLHTLGMIELIFGIVFICSWIASLGFAIGVTNQDPASFFYYRTFAIIYVSPGIWCGIFPVISGILGICAKKNTTPCMFVANMIMAIFTSIFMVILLGFSIPSAIVVSHPAIITFQVLNSIGSFIVFVVSIVHSAYCCGGVCCIPRSQPQVVYTSQMAGPGQQYVRLAGGQYILLQGQQVVQPYGPPAQGLLPPTQPVAQQQYFSTATSSVPEYPAAPYPPSKQWDPAAGNVDPSAPPPYNAVNYPDVPQ